MRSDFLYPPLESDSSYPFLLQNSCFASGNEGPARRQEETEFYGWIAAATSGGREEIERDAQMRVRGKREVREEKRDL